MKGEVVMVVRLPVSEVAAVVAEQHHIALPLSDFKLDGDSLVLSFTSSSEAAGGVWPMDSSVSVKPQGAGAPKTRPGGPHPQPSRRSARRKRHRMKTRGWDIVGTIKNSYGQTARIYRPFVEALSEKGLTTSQKRGVVAKILRANGNRPTDGSIDYYLMNTVEFLDERQKMGDAESGAPT